MPRFNSRLRRIGGLVVIVIATFTLVLPSFVTAEEPFQPAEEDFPLEPLVDIDEFEIEEIDGAILVELAPFFLELGLVTRNCTVTIKEPAVAQFVIGTDKLIGSTTHNRTGEFEEICVSTTHGPPDITCVFKTSYELRARSGGGKPFLPGEPTKVGSTLLRLDQEITHFEKDCALGGQTHPKYLSWVEELVNWPLENHYSEVRGRYRYELVLHESFK